MDAIDHPLLLCILLLLNYPVLVRIANWFYPDDADAFQGLKFWIQPYFWSALKGEGVEDMRHYLRSLAVVLVSGCLIAVEYKILTNLFF